MNNQLVQPRKALNKAFLKIKPNRTDIERFKANLITVLDSCNAKESEEFHKNLASDFLKNTYYLPNHFINTKNRNDLVIHNGKDAKSTVGVIIEAKSPANKAEMIAVDKLNGKALQELVLYFLRERITHKNLEIKHLVVTNIYEWFIFDAQLFEKYFAQNKAFVKQFEDFEAKQLSGVKTDFFYKDIAKPYIETIKNEIEFTYFNFKEYDKAVRNDDKDDDKSLVALFKLLSPEHLLKLSFANDSNSLDKNFYSELLHIIGLTETKDGGKKLIQRHNAANRNGGSLLENAIVQIDSLDKIGRLKNAKQYGETYDERLFNVALELTITWVNRILFLKLLEAQLISYHKGDKSYSFLNETLINDYDKLNKLFFQVLAKKTADRTADVATIYAKVPYLNSSLFEPTDLEHDTLFISNLEDEIPLPLLATTVIKDIQGKKEKGTKNALNYFFSFLDAYDFASEGSEDIQEDNKTLINASVLGLIFEKINGYKDGSFFTPGFITMYMCKETIRRAVVQKFNETKGWTCETIIDIHNKITDTKEANAIVNAIKICDPAVGSGHFLVSALNEIIVIKQDLGILQDAAGKKLRDYSIEIVNDELIVTDDDGIPFAYNPANKESQRIQETLFKEKETIIENCLFGVDINPNSVKICRLRLWIELLKNAFYKFPSSGGVSEGRGGNFPSSGGVSEGLGGNFPSKGGELETLPNIDINIKCGNSLISRFGLDTDLKKALQQSKWNIESYKLAVATYRNAENKQQKREMERLIDDIKGSFRSEIADKDPKKLKLEKQKGELFNYTQQVGLFERSKKEQTDWNKKVNTLAADITMLETEIEAIKSNAIYENAFEWRFEFPEVLNDAGDFVGFDVVIGNPPYGMILTDISEKKYIIENFKTVSGKHEIYKYFIEKSLKILSNNGFLTFITPDTWLQLGNFELLRKLIIDNHNFISTTKSLCNVFDEATVDTIVFCINNKYSKDKFVKILDENFKSIIKLEPVDYIISFNVVPEVINKINSIKTTLNDFTEIWQGLIAYGKKDQERIYSSNIKETDEHRKLLYGRDIGKYSISFSGEYLKYGNWLHRPRPTYIYDNNKILVQRIRNPKLKTRLVCTIDEQKYVNGTGLSNILLKENANCSLSFVLGLLNSKLLNFWFSFYFNDVNIKPEQLRKIPFIKNEKNNISSAVNQILNLKKANPLADTSVLEHEIDVMVYHLYNLTFDEACVIDGGLSLEDFERYKL